MSTRALLAAFVVLGLIVAACGGDTAASTTEGVTGTTGTPAEVTTTVRSTGDVTITPPPEIGAGTDFTVAWTGPNNEGDYLTIVVAGADEGAYESYFYTASGPEGELVAPPEEGEYEIRYVDGASTGTVHSVTVTVLAFVITMEAPDETEAGAEFEAGWTTGPDGPGDYLTIVAVGADEGAYDSYFYTSSGPEGTLVAPVEAGDYEIRYVSGSTTETLGTIPITVTPFTVTLEAPDSVAAGTTFDVEWTGPNGPGDYITIVEAGAPDGSYLSYVYTAQGSPATLTAPDASGDYEVRYVTDRVGAFTFLSIPIEVN